MDMSRSDDLLERGILFLCKRAIGQHRWDIAEHLLAALETVSRTAPETSAALEQAYLWIADCDAIRGKSAGRRPRSRSGSRRAFR